MAMVKSFKAIRPTADYAKVVAALPYDVMNTAEARAMVKGNPYSFLHIDKAEIDFEPEIHLYDEKVYERAKNNLDQLMRDKVLVQDQTECLYIYRLIMGNRAQTGLVCCTSIDDYINQIIKKHEHTRTDKEQDRIKHVDVCNANTGPIFLTYKTDFNINALLDNWTNQYKPQYYFTADDGVIHTIWCIHDSKKVAEISRNFERIDNLYIADGHHRAASAVKVGLKRREENPNYKGSEEFNYFLSVLFADNELKIMDYNRVVKDLGDYTFETFMEEIKKQFMVEKFDGRGPYKPDCVHSFGMYLDGNWYKLKAKPDSYDPTDPVGKLDVSILQNNLLGPILGIEDPREDNRIDFVGGIRGLGELEKRVKEEARVAFSMCPTSIEELMEIADNNKMMPPKSTWFEPKLRSGLFIHKLS